MGSPVPSEATGGQWIWLGLSGIIGLALGDAFLFQAYVHIGARLTTLIMALDPVFSTIIAWVWLGEELNAVEIVGILVTIFGVGWVVLERTNANGSHSKKDLLLGILCGIGAVLGQAIGFVLTKKGLANDFSPLSGVVIRILVATIVMWGLAFLHHKIRFTLDGFKDTIARNNIIAGSIVGPTRGVWLSMVAVQLIPVGIASTIMATRPVIMIPLSRYIYHEKTSPRAFIGTVIALVGVAIIFLLG
jgi:drug/metabolite transporter (DMT)-like permease